MASTPVKRVVVCVDGTWFDQHGLPARREGNNSNIYRIYATIKKGTFVQANRAVKQVAYYESGVGLERQPLDTFNESVTTSSEACDQQVNRIFAFCCQQLADSTDELWLFGFGRGAYISRLVADLFHQLATIRSWDETEYRRRISLLPAFKGSHPRTLSAHKAFRYVTAKGWASRPVIHFLGLLDNIKTTRDSTRTQPLLLKSTQTIRHALALNETRPAFQPSPFGPLPALSPDLLHRSCIEAWFIGSHADIGGGARDDGLSLYPLQWMLLESRAHGLILEPAWDATCLVEEPLGLVFPLIPDPSDATKPRRPLDPWVFRYANGIQVEMVDIRSSHRHGNLQKKVPPKRLGSRQRKTSQSSSGSGSELQYRTSWRERLSRLSKKGSKASLASSRREGGETDSLHAGEGVEVGPRPHVVMINSGPALRSLFAAPRTVFDNGVLVGYLDKIPCGTIIHPSVYFVTDVYDRLGFNGELDPLVEGLNNFRQTAFVKQEVHNTVHMDPWRATLADLGGPALKNCRVLVCGRAGVGKSTLINKVFGTVVTAESTNEHGIHDVDEGFEMDTLPGLIVHDSRGFQSGATEEIDLLEKFIRKRAMASKPEDRLDAIWFCIDVPSTRILHEADKKIFDVLDRHARAVPVIIVRTMKDRFINEHYGAARAQLEDAGYHGEEVDQMARAQAEEELARVREEDIRFLELKLGLEKDFAPFVYTSRRDNDSIKDLVRLTITLVPDDDARANFVSAQIADVDMKITAAIEESLRLLNFSNWSGIMGSMMFTSVLTTPTISHFLCARIIKSFGLSGSAKVNEVERIARELLWKNMGSFVTQSFTQFAVLLSLGVGLTMSTIIGGLPALASLPFAYIPPASRLIMKCTCDLVLILAAAFTRKGKFVTKQDFEEALAQYCAGGLGSVRSRVHGEIDRLIPIHSVKVFEPLSITRMRSEMRLLISRHRFALDEKFVYVEGETGTEVEVGVEDVRGLNQWIDGKEIVPSTGVSLPDQANLGPSKDVTWSASSSPDSSHMSKSQPQSPYTTEPRTQTFYDAESKIPVVVAELPGTAMLEPWNGGISELPGSMVIPIPIRTRYHHHRDMPELQ